jgi:hypothetical protein
MADVHKYDNGHWLATAIPHGTKVVIEIDGTNVTIHQQSAKKDPDAIKFTFLDDLRDYLAPRVQKTPKFIICGVIASGGQCEAGFLAPNSLVITDVCQIEGNDLFGQTLMKRMVHMDRLFPSNTMAADTDGTIRQYAWLGYVYNSIYKAHTFTSAETCETFPIIADEIQRYPFYEGLLLRNPEAKLDYLYNSSYNTHGYQFCKK